MVHSRNYKLGSEFPAEFFVQQAVEAHFLSKGFSVDTSTHIDLLCRHSETGELWQIEAKGKTSQPGLDFRTCLGQLLQRMNGDGINYSVAVPRLPQYLAQISQTSSWAAERLNISWVLVDPDGHVSIERSGARHVQR